MCHNFRFTKLNSPLFVKCVRKFTLPLKAFPAPALLSKNRSALRKSNFVQGAIEKLLNNQCIVETLSSLDVVNPLSVSVGKKLRLIYDLKYVNQFLQNKVSTMSI